MRVLSISMGEVFGGIEKMEIEIAKFIGNKTKFDILVPNNTIFKNYENNVYNLNIKRNSLINKLKYVIRLFKFLQNNKYDVIHINSSAFFFSFHVALIAKLCKVKRIIVHIHSIPKINKFKRAIIYMFEPMYTKLIDKYLACSQLAIDRIYSKRILKKINVQIIKNGINIGEFKFNESYRKKYEDEFRLQGKVVYANIARFEKEKNHLFLIDIFYEIQKIQKNSVLLLIGEGMLKNRIIEKVNRLKISDKVLFLGFRDDVNKILNCIDIFILPSLYEGLGMVAIEAQTNGVFVYCSNNIPIEAKISSSFKYFDLKSESIDIAKDICKTNLKLINRKSEYKNAIKNGYDIKDMCKNLEIIYSN